MRPTFDLWWAADIAGWAALGVIAFITMTILHRLISKRSRCKWKRAPELDQGALKAWRCKHCQEAGYRTMGKPSCLKGVSGRPL